MARAVAILLRGTASTNILQKLSFNLDTVVKTSDMSYGPGMRHKRLSLKLE
jgi:hypothetical protein